MRRTTLAISLGLALIAGPAAASAATITPSVLTDELDASNANCSLREAISIANTDSNTAEPDCAIVDGLGDDTISLGAGTYLLELTGPGDDTNATGDLDVDPAGTAGDLTIDGVEVATTTIDTDETPGWTERVIHHVLGASPLVVSDLTLTGGNETSASGGGIFMPTGSLVLQSARVTGNDAANSGGGINAASGSSLSILDSIVDDNSSTAGLGGGGVFAVGTTTIDSSVISDNDATLNGASGGGIFATGAAGAMTITDSVIADNTAESTGITGALGGGIHHGNGSLTIRGTTISDNQVLGGASRLGAGINSSSTGGLALVNSTVSGNKAELTGGSAGGLRFSAASGTATIAHTTFGPNPVGFGTGSAIRQFLSGTLNVRSSVIETSGAASACTGAISSQGFNVFTDSTCGAPTTGDEANADPLLGPLQDNGGPDAGAPGLLEPILTHAPAAASTAIDRVPAADCDDELGAPLLLDQRGLGRPFENDGDGVAECDAGSLESQTAFTPPPPAGAGQPPATQPVPAKKCKKGRKLKKGKCVKKKKRKRK